MNYREGNVSLDGVKIHYYRAGCGNVPLVMLHGATDNGLCWAPVAAQLTQKYDIIMMDAQGHGKSDHLDEKFQFASHTAQVVGLLKELGITAPVIMGHSMGAGTTVNIAVNYPAVPKAIILEDPAWMDPPPPGTLDEGEAVRRQEFARLVEAYGTMTMEEIKAQGKKLNPAWSEEELVPWAESKKQFDPTLFQRLRIDSPTYRELVPKINCPTLLITAESGIVTQAAAATAAELWKSSHPFRHVYIKGAGHSIRRENFGDYLAAVTEFLNDVA